MTWLTLFLINWAINILAIEFLVFRKIKPIIKVDEQRDSKYKAFRRTDVAWFNRPWLYLTCHFAIVKVILSWSALVVCGIICKFVVMGMKEDEPIKGIRYFIIRVTQWCTSVVVIFGGCTNIWISTKRSPICYKKYLGPDWKPDYNWRNAGCKIANHTTSLDTANNSLQQLSSFVAKYEAQFSLGIGTILRATQCLVLNRESKASKKLVQE